jgi:large subunit ribosomal protein L3
VQRPIYLLVQTQLNPANASSFVFSFLLIFLTVCFFSLNTRHTMPPKLPRQALCLGQQGWVEQILVNFTSKRQFGIRSLNPPKHSNYDSRPGLPLLTSTPEAALERKIKADVLPLRTGALAIKQGMTAIYDPETGKRIPCTVLQLDRVQVVAHKTAEKHGYFAVQVGAGWKKPNRVTRALLGHFSTAGVAPKRYVQEFRVRDSTGLLDVGEEITADWFQEGQFIDARSNTKGKGFAGVMKRHGFHGQDRSHGVSLTHRSHGSLGPGQGGGSRVYPGKKMAGNMGGERNTLQNLKVLKVDSENGIVVVNGMAPGSAKHIYFCDTDFSF